MEHLDPEADAERLRAAVGAFVRQARSGRDVLPRAQAAALGHLLRDGELTIVALANRERVRHQSMARTVALLGDRELVQTRSDPDDRRRVLVTITQAGERLLTAERRKRSAWIARVTQHALDEQEREVLRQVPDILATLIAYDTARDNR